MNINNTKVNTALRINIPYSNDSNFSTTPLEGGSQTLHQVLIIGGKQEFWKILMGEKRWEVAPIQLQATYNQASLSPDTSWDRSNMPLLLSALPGPVWGLVRLASAFFSRSPPSVGGLFTSSPPSTHVLSKPPPEKLTWNPHHLYL